MPILMTVFAFSNMIATGASVRIGILLGEKKRKEASDVFSFSIKTIFIISVLIGTLGLVFAKPFVCFISPGASEEAISHGTTYFRIHSLFSPLLLTYFATDNYLRLCGKEKLSMWISIGTQILNIVLDVILIAFLGQGIWAAAFTSCIAMALGSVITLSLFLRKRMDLYYTRNNISLKKFTHILANGSSEFFSNISMSVMSIIFNLFLLKYGGTTAVAAFSVVMYVDSIVGMLTFGMCDSLQPAISYCYGARLYNRVKTLFRMLITGAVFLSFISLIFMMFAGPYVAPVFIKPGDTELLAVSIVAMRLFSLSYLTGWIDMCFSSFFTSVERPIRSLITSFFGTLIFPVTFLFILTPMCQLNGVWLSPLISGSASALLTAVLAGSLKLNNK
jgi:putative MATE family efflux protein